MVDPEPIEYSRYSDVYDATLARYDSATGMAHVIIQSETYAEPPPEPTPAELKSLAIKQAALRIAAGLDPRPLREVAKEIGCRHTAIDNALGRICQRLNIRKHHVSDEVRAKMSEARLANLAKPTAPTTP